MTTPEMGREHQMVEMLAHKFQTILEISFLF
jgi:hypothetical protein